MSHVAGEFAFCAVAEANEKDVNAYDEASGFKNLFLEAAGLLSPTLSPDDWPLEMARAIESILVSWHEEDRGARAVLYAGVMLSPRNVFVCTAGDCRVHLVSNNQLVASTRDHNVIDDPVSEFTVDNDPRLLPMYLRSTTRLIGIGDANRPPECPTWGTDGDYTVLIATSGFHEYRSPSEYIDPFMEGKSSLLSNLERPVGVLIKIERIVKTISRAIV